jgi:hypothetical protein
MRGNYTLQIESNEIIEIATPGVSKKGKVYNALTNYPYTATFVSTTIIYLTAFRSFCDKYAWSGWFASGARETYEGGYNLALAKYADVSPISYVPLPMSTYQHELFSLEEARLAAHNDRFLGLSFMSGLTISAVFMNLLAMKNTNNTDGNRRFRNLIAGAFLLTLVIQTAIYASLDGFSARDRLANSIYQSGSLLESSLGAIDGQNYYCVQMNYTGVCPDPKEGWQTIQNYLPHKDLITSLNESLLLLFMALAPFVFAPICSVAVTSAKSDIPERVRTSIKNFGRHMLLGNFNDNNARPLLISPRPHRPIPIDELEAGVRTPRI